MKAEWEARERSLTIQLDEAHRREARLERECRRLLREVDRLEELLGYVRDGQRPGMTLGGHRIPVAQSNPNARTPTLDVRGARRAGG